MAVIICPHCGTDIQAPDDSEVRNGHAQSSEHGREWIVMDGGRVLHRCADRPLPASYPPAIFSQAVGMISVQANCTMDEAETKLRDRAALEGESVYDLAADVLERRVRFT